MLEEIKAFAQAKQKEYRDQCDWQLKYIVSKGGGSEGLGIAQSAFRAYTSILEIIAGEKPCDPITVKEDDSD